MFSGSNKISTNPMRISATRNNATYVSSGMNSLNNSLKVKSLTPTRNINSGTTNTKTVGGSINNSISQRTGYKNGKSPTNSSNTPYASNQSNKQSISVNKIKSNGSKPLTSADRETSPFSTQRLEKRSLLGGISNAPVSSLKYMPNNILSHKKNKNENLQASSNRTKTPSVSSKDGASKMSARTAFNVNRSTLNSTRTKRDKSGNNSFEKSYGSHSSNEGRLKVSKIGGNKIGIKSTSNSKSPPNTKLGVSKFGHSPGSTVNSKQFNSNKTNKMTVSYGTNQSNKSKSPSNNKKQTTFLNNIASKKPSLLKQYENLKNRSVSPIGNLNREGTPTTVSKNNSKNDTLNNIKVEEKHHLKNGTRGTIQVSKPEYFFKTIGNKEQQEKERNGDKKVKNVKDFRENNTSPLVVRKKATDNNSHFNTGKSLIETKMLNENSEKNNRQSISAKSCIIKKIAQICELSKIGFSGPGVKKVNQDNFFIFKNFNDDPNSLFIAVCDGHGMYGHDVSSYLKENLPVSLHNEFKSKKKVAENRFNLNKTIEDVFLSTNSRLFNEASIDTNFSGSTCVSVICFQDKLICANVGDSRAVLGRYVNGVWTSHNLSRDHKPSEKNEAARIKRRGGRIEPYKDEDDEFIGPPRVWLKSEDIPGLAMTRSFGDQIAASVGVLSEPEISEWKFTSEDKFLVLASDGVWEFIESEECVNIIKDFYLKGDAQGACEYLVQESARRWMAEEEVIDDTTLILVFFE